MALEECLIPINYMPARVGGRVLIGVFVKSKNKPVAWVPRPCFHDIGVDELDVEFLQESGTFFQGLLHDKGEAEFLNYLENQLNEECSTSGVAAGPEIPIAGSVDKTTALFRQHLDEAQQHRTKIWKRALGNRIVDPQTLVSLDREILGGSRLKQNTILGRLLDYWLPPSSAPDPQPRTSNLPVNPNVVFRVRDLLKSEDYNLNEVVKLLSSEPVLAAEIIGLANTMKFVGGSPERTQVTTLSRAVGVIGTSLIFKVVVAGAARALYATHRLNEIWTHSIEVARSAEQIAIRCRYHDPEEAYAAGLLHDIGAIAIASLPPAMSQKLKRLADYGWPRLYREILTVGTSHAKLGGELLRRLGVPEVIAVAVAEHHGELAEHDGEQHFTNDLSAILHLAERALGEEEEFPTNSKFFSALEAIGLLGSQLPSGIDEDQVTRALRSLNSSS